VIVRGLLAAFQGDDAAARGSFEAQRSSPPRILDHQIRLSLALGEREVALRQIEASPYHRNYRWLAGEPLARPFLGEPGFRKLLDELHEEWLRNLTELLPRLPVVPPQQPTPAQLLTRSRASPSARRPREPRG
jgi:hypothetical protein